MKRYAPPIIGLLLGCVIVALFASVLSPPNQTATQLRGELDDYRVIFLSLLPAIGLVGGIMIARRRS